MAELFGFNITRVRPKTDPKQQFSQPQAEDGTQTVAAGGFFGSYLDMEGTAKTEQDLIRRYREIALHPECDMAVEDIVNEAITSNENRQSVKVVTDNLDYSSKIRQAIETEFSDVLRLLQFNTRGHDLFRRWYVDGRIFFQKIIDAENPKNGITELKYLDPRKIKKIREVRKRRPEGMVSPTNINIADETVEYFVYNERGIQGAAAIQGIKIAPDTIAYCPSGVIDQNKKRSSAVVIKKDLKRDLALLKTNAKGKKVSFYNGAIKQGAKVEALGHPRGKKFSISQGIVSAIRNESSVYNVSGINNVLFIQTDAAINKGNSGGPLFLDIKVVGVNTKGLSKKSSEGMNFAVHFSEVLDFLK